MRIVSITEAKRSLDTLLDQVVAGEDVLISECGRPVARLIAVSRAHPGHEGRANRLELAGILSPSRGGSLKSLLSHPPVRTSKRVDVLEALLDERKEGA